MSTEAWHKLSTDAVAVLSRVPAALLLLVCFWLAGRAVGSVAARMVRGRQVDTSLAIFAGQALKFTLLAFGVVTALGTLGVDVAALVAGLGLTGFAVGLALRDILSNALSGILVLLSHQFRRGDQVAVQGFEGRVVEVNLRYTVLESEGRTIFVPNATLSANVVVVSRPDSSPYITRPPETPLPPPGSQEIMPPPVAPPPPEHH